MKHGTTKSLGIVRKIDELGRIVLPMELRRSFDINEKDPMEIFTDGDKIILRKYQPGCIICGESDKEIAATFNERHICTECLAAGERAAAAEGVLV